MQGFVYVLINQSMPSIVKIGRTTRHPKDRAEELATTGVPSEFTVVYYQKFDDCVTAESEIHARFTEFRINKGREFFSISPKEAIDAIQILNGKIGEGETDSKSEKYLFLYHSKIATRKYRIGLFIAESKEILNNIEEDQLRRNIENSYSLEPESAEIIDHVMLSRYVDSEKREMEKLIQNEISNELKAVTYWSLSNEDDNQTIKVSSSSYMDYPPDALFKSIKNSLRRYVEKNDVDGLYKRKKLSERKFNI